MQTDALEVVVDRTRWSRGKPGSLMLNELTDQMCIFGFACLAAGATEEQIAGLTTVDELIRIRRFKHGQLGALSFAVNNAAWDIPTTEPARLIMRFNDQRLGTNYAETSGIFTEEDREQRLADFFAVQKIKVTYIN